MIFYAVKNWIFVTTFNIFIRLGLIGIKIVEFVINSLKLVRKYHRKPVYLACRWIRYCTNISWPYFHCSTFYLFFLQFCYKLAMLVTFLENFRSNRFKVMEKAHFGIQTGKYSPQWHMGHYYLELFNQTHSFHCFFI